MKISELWLREWVNPSLTGPQLAAQLTMAGLEVDGLNPVAGQFNHVVVAEVMQTTPHPQADKLTLCKIDAGTGSLIDVVCGAANVRTGLRVALALPGSELPGGVFIKASMLRGQPSNGMLCSGDELGFEDGSEGIMELPEDAPIGVNLREYLSLDDHVLEIDLTPNRADCFSILGVAREVAALNGLVAPEVPCKIHRPESQETIAVQLQAPNGCPRYCGRVIRAIHPNASTPFWMKERLRRSGIRAIHPVVDVTNYVMLELGQPMHAFDLNTLKGSIEVRYARDNETLLLLDGQDVVLGEQVLVIADQSKPLALAGVMGGEASAVQANTTDIFLESAFFDPLTVAGVARHYNLCSDSSQRFERGVDPTLQNIALERATELLLTIVGGQVGPITDLNQPESLPKAISISFNPSKVKQLTGIAITKSDMIDLLQRLGLVVESLQEPWTVSVPPHRFDIRLDVDLVEEIIRLYGYDNIKAEPMVALMHAGRASEEDSVSNKIALFLCNKGYYETISYSFVDPELQQELYPDAETMRLLNPISSELSEMRIGMWPGLLASMVHNAHRQQTAIKLFESGVVFDVKDKALQERSTIAGLITGERGHLNWSEPARKFDFYDLKGDLEALFVLLNISNVRFVSATHPALHPGQTARILVGENAIGWIGVLHPRILDALDHNNEVIVFELSLKPLLSNSPPRYKSISKYPQIRRDLSMLVSKEITAAQIEQVVRGVVASDWLKAFDIFDVYTGEPIPVDKKSVAMALTLQDDTRTLVDAEINTTISAIIKKLDDEFAIILRD